ncbi:MAG: EAL domain-containing protein [Rhodanobacter sp.]|jgi:diguanylate cyclase (GGDEF)-like protein/PAS domain S-box-containing protein|uniref:EAL domain-containing protein n=2 Tax=unclassified Rhodanobacter TaxID=2621553 RepID=A0AB74UW97_9GAMM|nr:EAL domain-containing protein [Rhodanobacter sp.]MBN8946199.1 EAL domain-containing protein [Rhodanobacter sp.]ODT97156.1 MAG: diguanylate cyclase [Rhodanobacter sp. SCN 67-45]OJW31465.1 MAG: diguanylate cyclase [Rhodanobacter sp. 67-28]
MKKDFVIKILFVENSLEEAEQIISLMRNSGIAVRPARATNIEQIRSAVGELEPDVVMFDPSVTDVSLDETMGVMEASGRDFALVGLVSNMDNELVADLFVHGARGVASRTHPKQLIAVLKREFESLHTRRQVRWLHTALRETERRCDALLDSSTDAIAYVHEGMHVRANQAYLDTFGYESFDDLLGMPLLDMIDSANADEMKALLRGQAHQGKFPAQLPLRARRADDSRFDATVEFAPATFEGERCLQIVFRRQVVDPAVLEQLQRDPVTGLYNRQHMLACIDDAVTEAAKGKKGQSLLLIEPDNWASLVSGIGLGKTDELLAGFAGRIRMLLGATDIAGMLAEHTFGVALDSRSDEAIREWIAKLQHSVGSEIFDAGTRSLTVTASVGGSLLGEKNANSELLLNQASHALRTAQNLGGSQVELHDPAAREKADEERERYWLDLLQQALANNGLVLYHQQTISLQDAEGEFSEILLRMNGPQGEVLPGFFMPIAEKHNLTGAVDRWVLDQAIRILQAREPQGQPTTFFIKLTAASLQDDSLLPWLKERLGKAGLKHGRLVLEMTESKVMTLLRPAQEFVNAWKKMGGGFALEQFGSGLNSFQLLNHIDADYLKIDRSHMADLPQHADSQKKVAEICQQAHELKRLTIAEWVEDATSTSLLFACGVDFVQGNFLQVPQRLE